MNLGMRFIVTCLALTIGVAAFVQFDALTETPPEAATPDGKHCITGGCSGQLCVDAALGDVMSTCEWTPAYGCYKEHGTCEAQTDGTCGWTQTAELMQCLDNPEKEFPLDRGLAK